MSKLLPSEKPVPFTHGFKFPGLGNTVTFEAGSYTAWMESMLPGLRKMPTLDHDEAHAKGVRVGKFIFYKRLFPAWRKGNVVQRALGIEATRNRLPIYGGMRPAYASFTDDVAIPTLSDHDLRPWMSLTPNEILTQRSALHVANGDVAIAGMGLGWMARKLLERPKVSHLTVYEQDPDVIRYFGGKLTGFGDRLTVICADAYEVNWSAHDVSIWDIWEEWGEAATDERYQGIRNQILFNGKVCVGWGDIIGRLEAQDD